MNYDPVYQKRSMKYGSEYWESYSPKIKRIVRFFSTLEYKNWLQVEMNEEITDFCEQPLEIEVEIDGKTVKSIFDMWVKYQNGIEEFWEVKYQSVLKQEDKKYERSRKQIAKQKKWCETRGIPHQIRTEKEIELGAEYINNLNYMVHCKKQFEPYVIDRSISYTQSYYKSNQKNHSTINELSTYLYQYYEHPEMIISILIGKGILEADYYNQEINFAMEVTFRGK